eukprot:537445_1
MSTLSQLNHQIEHRFIVIQHIKTFRLQSLPHLNNNESADKTAKQDNRNHIQQIRTHKHKRKENNHNTQLFAINCIKEEKTMCSYTISMNSWINYSNRSVDPPPGQHNYP